MVYQDYSQNRPHSKRDSQSKPKMPDIIEAEPLPEDYVEKAEEVIKGLIDKKINITTSKIRNLLSFVSEIYNIENNRDDPELLPRSQSLLTMMRIRTVYEAGRERKTVKVFVEDAKLLQHIKDIGKSREKLIDFSHYMEALVAYHRFYGGKEG